MLFGFGLLAAGSAVWSIIPAFSLVRGAQVVVIAMLSTMTTYAWRHGLRSFHDDWRRIWISFLLGVTLLGLSGLLWPVWANGRFAWQGAHPITAASFLAAAGIAGISLRFDRGWAISRRAQRLLPLAIVFVVTLLVLTVARRQLSIWVPLIEIGPNSWD